jgi:Sulfotransferase family
MTETIAGVPSLAAALAAAEESTGLRDWGGDGSWRTGLGEVLAAARADPRPAVREAVTAEVARLLAIRLRLAADEAAHPEITAAPVDRPLVIVGFPRTGTTYLHELLTLDPAARAPLAWESRAPWPAPEVATYDRDPRIAATQARYDAMLATRPEFQAMHAFGARLPAECQEIIMLHFASANFWHRFGLAPYAAWFAAARPAGKYRTHKRVLQELQWKGPRGRWTLKSPEHLFDLAELLETYPDACLVQTHRDPATAMASLARLIHANQAMYFPEADPREVGAIVRALWGTALERAAADRALPGVDGAVLDIAYRDLVARPLDAVRAIYERFGLPYTNEFHRALTGHLQQQRSGHGEGGGGGGADFGLSAAELAGAFPGYRERFSGLWEQP